MIERDIELGDVLPVRQHAYRLPVEKRERMDKEDDRFSMSFGG